ncbi:hypothetical protein ACIA03_23295 [Nocardioides sp. NPDC051685]|uniref:hypothetical protein n=1 Tax=Nocardioides sp. NPDC051685 TaxID=3364334 RepID=UPI00378C1303
MTDQLKFFSEEWCAAAAAAHVGELAEQASKALRDAANFNHILGFGVTDRPDLTNHVEIVAGRVVNWSTTNVYPDDQLLASFQGKVEHYREAAEGKTPAANLVMGGKVRLIRGTMKDAIENAKALNVIIAAWGDLPTDWDV